MAKYIYGIHEYDNEWASMVRDSGVDAWSLELTELSSNFSGRDFRFDSVTPIIRLNWGYGSTGTLPLPEKYDEFAYRCAEFIKHSQGIQRVHIGNELSLQWEWPNGIMPTVEQYVQAYHKTYNAIKSVNPNIMITFAPPAPWNPTWGGDWVDIIPKLCDMIGHDKIDFFALHAYTKGYNLNGFTKLQPMDAPYQHRNFSFAVLYEQMNAIPKDMRHLEVHITEANGDGAWNGNYSGQWIQEFYKQINEWNSNEHNQKILSGILFRWNKNDTQWDISQDQRSKDDFKSALQWKYEHKFTGNKPDLPKINPKLPRPVGPYVNAELGLNLRNAPNGKVLTVLTNGTQVTVRLMRGDWLNVDVPNTPFQGWVHKNYIGGF